MFEALKYPKFLEGARFVEAQQWHNSFKPIAEKNYEPALLIARRRYDESREDFRVLDRKAEWTLGLGAALFAFAMNAEFSFFYACPSYTLVLFSMLLTFYSRLPQRYPSTYSARDMIDLVEHSGGSEPVAWEAASLYCTTISMRAVINWKASLLRYAGYALLIGTAGMLLPMAMLSGEAEAKQKKDQAEQASTPPGLHGLRLVKA